MIKHVAVGDVRELVAEHALDLLRLEAAPEAGGDRDHGVLRVPAGRERVRDVGVDDRDPRLREVGHRAEALDHRVQLGRLLRGDDLRPRGGEGELVRRPVLDGGQADDDHEHRGEPDVQGVEEDEGEADVEEAEQAAREEHPQREPPVPAEVSAFHGSIVAPATLGACCPPQPVSRPVKSRPGCVAQSSSPSESPPPRACSPAAAPRASCRRHPRRWSAPCRRRRRIRSTAAFKLKGDPAAGAKVFQSAGCVGCHTLAAAHATGTVGPNLDQVKPNYRRATARVTLGKNVMPSFQGKLSTQQIADVAAYVVKSTGGTP